MTRRETAKPTYRKPMLAPTSSVQCFSNVLPSSSSIIILRGEIHARSPDCRHIPDLLPAPSASQQHLPTVVFTFILGQYYFNSRFPCLCCQDLHWLQMDHLAVHHGAVPPMSGQKNPTPSPEDRTKECILPSIATQRWDLPLRWQAPCYLWQWLLHQFDCKREYFSRIRKKPIIYTQQRY